MAEQWFYQCAGMRIVHGLAQKATNGFIGVTPDRELRLFNNKGVEFDHAPVSEVLVKSGLMGTSVKMNGSRYQIDFHPLAQNLAGGFGLIGAALGSAMGGFSKEPDTRSEKQKRKEFVETINRLQ